MTCAQSFTSLRCSQILLTNDKHYMIATHQHFLQRAKIVPVSLPIYCFLDTNCVSQPYEFLTDIYSLCKTSALKKNNNILKAKVF